jgi:hypothetical protein
MRFERSVPAADNAFEIVLFSYSGVPVPARDNYSTERDQRFESGFLQRRVCKLSVPSESSAPQMMRSTRRGRVLLPSGSGGVPDRRRRAVE